jgi:hypothetical protein
MAKARPSVQFTYERTYTVRPREFRLFKNVEYLDTAKLSKGSHTIELGTFEGGNCDGSVTAKIRNGKVTGIDVPKCESTTEIPPKLAKKLDAARNELAKRVQSKWEDLPVQEMVTSPAARARIIIVITGTDDCYEVCIDPGTGLKTCWICCPKEGWGCIGPSDPHVALF